MQIFKDRRDFIKLSLYGFGTAIFSSGLTACDDILSGGVSFTHGIASGDPLADRVILWTRAFPQNNDLLSKVRIAWEVALDPEFKNLVNAGSTETSADRDYTVKIDAAGLKAGTRYYYRFKSKDAVSAVGTCKTLIDASAEQVKLAIVSCSNFPAGRFHVYKEVAQRTDIDAVLHLGDYIYEYARGEYASEQAKDMGREVLPEGEIITLSDYRTRYALYRSDADLQAVHQNHAFIAVWDDHEIANNSWKDGAENHQEAEGEFATRKLHALQAYSEWMPIRLPSLDDHGKIYRSFSFGRLVALHMLDTRHIGRDKPLSYLNYVSETGLDAASALADLADANRSLLGDEQRAWLQERLSSDNAVWQVLGQQVLMGRMYLPGALATQLISLSDFGRLVKLATMAAQGMELSPEDMQFLGANQKFLKMPAMPFNIDAWDGFEAERQKVLQFAKQSQRNLIVLAGDSHNAWVNELVDADGAACGVEFAAPSVSSPGLEVYLGIKPEAVVPTEMQLLKLVPQLKHLNINDRGYLTVNFTESEATADFYFVDSVKTADYKLLSHRYKSFKVKAGENKLSPA